MMLVEASTAMRSSLPPPLDPLESLGVLAAVAVLAALGVLAAVGVSESLSPPPQAMAASASAPVRIAASASLGTWMRFIIGASLIQRLGWTAYLGDGDT